MYPHTHVNNTYVSLPSEITTFDGKPDRRDYDYKTVVPLLPTKKKRSPKTDSTRKSAPEAVRDTPIAHDMSPDDRLTLLKCTLYSGVIPDDDGAEGLPGRAAATESTTNQPLPCTTGKKAQKHIRALIGEKIIKPLVTRFKQRKGSLADTQEEEYDQPEHYEGVAPYVPSDTNYEGVAPYVPSDTNYEGVAPYVPSDTNYEQICINQTSIEMEPKMQLDGNTNAFKPPIPLKPSSIREAKDRLRKTSQTPAVNSTNTQVAHLSDIKAEKNVDTKVEHFSDKKTEHVHDTYQVQRHNKQTVQYENTQTRYIPNAQVEYPHDTKHFYDTPQVHFTDTPQVHLYDIPQVHFTDTPQIHFTDTPQVHFSDTPQVHLYDTPQVHFSDTPKVHFTDTPQVYFSDTPKVHFTDAPQVHFSDTQEVHIRSLADIPGDLSSLSVEQVAECLDLLHMSGCKDLFQYHMIDGEMLQCLDDESVLKQEFGLSPFEARKLVKFAKGYRPKTS